MVFCNVEFKWRDWNHTIVTILILIDGFLQYKMTINAVSILQVTILILIDGFLQYPLTNCIKHTICCHNPYFNRWFSAIHKKTMASLFVKKVTILILIDGFLQLDANRVINTLMTVTILILIDGFLQS